jgi:hypothetical protein
VEQLQCYCTTQLCGAGMLDARAALAAAGTSPGVNATLSPADPVADATGPAFIAAVATPGWIGGAIAAPNSIEATSIEASSIDVSLIDARLSAPVLGADTGATTTTLRVAAAPR